MTATPAAELRQAAVALRAAANVAAADLAENPFWSCYEPAVAWREGLVNGFGDSCGHAALLPPAAGLALADWLWSTADLHEPNLCEKHHGCAPLGCQWCADQDWPCADVRHALALARQILGTPAAVLNHQEQL